MRPSPDKRMQLPFSQACENNKTPILEVIRNWFRDGETILEVGSGTGQHAVYFAENMPGVIWQCADQTHYHSIINQRVADAQLPNLFPAIDLDVLSFNWRDIDVDSVFSANTAHIMPWSAVEAMFIGIGALITDGVFVLYGPFNRDGEFTSESNFRFHQSLQREAPHMGIRNDADLGQLARRCGLTMVKDIDMPANNRILIWRSASRR